MSSFDVIVVGAGPAGSMAALALARAGRRVALLDRAVFPRAKVCGNCVNPRTWKIWDRFGLTNSFAALPHQEVSGFNIHSEGRDIYQHAFGSPGHGPRVISRDVLDDWLRREAQAAGAEFFPDTKVTSLDSLSGKVQTSQGEFTGKLIFGADGRNSLVARHAGLMPPQRRCHRIGWSATIPAPASLDDRIHMHLYEEGYFGYVRTNSTHAVISMILDSRRSQDPLLPVRRYLPEVADPSWLRLNPITRAAARTGSGRVWLIGDAARVVEPFTGEGIAFALTTGVLAAETALTALPREAFTPALNLYAQSHRRLYLHRAWVNTLVRWALTSPAHVVRLLRKTGRLPDFVTLLSRQVHAAS